MPEERVVAEHRAGALGQGRNHLLTFSKVSARVYLLCQSLQRGLLRMYVHKLYIYIYIYIYIYTYILHIYTYTYTYIIERTLESTYVQCWSTRWARDNGTTP